MKELKSGVSEGLDNLLRHFAELSSIKNVFLTPIASRRPILDLTVDQVVTKTRGESALITCIVSNKGKHSLMWRRVSKSRGPDELLTINGEAVTDDERVNVLHEVEGDVYVLAIQNLTVHDSGIYSCELNNNNFNKFFDIYYFEALMSCLPDGHEHCCAAGINYQNNY